MTVEQIRALLGLGPEISDAEVVNLYAAWLAGETGVPAVTATQLLPLALVKQHLRVDHAEEDALITAYIEAAVGAIDGPGGSLGRAIRVQSLVHRIDRFTTTPIKLPYPPLIEVDSVTYLDAGGIQQTVPAEVWAVEHGRLVAAHGARWPAALNRRGSIAVTYQAGYAELPAAVHDALLLMILPMYERRPPSADEERAIGSKLAPFKIWAI